MDPFYNYVSLNIIYFSICLKSNVSILNSLFDKNIEYMEHQAKGYDRMM